VRTSLLFASLRGCYLRGLDVVLGPCAQLAVGRLKGEGSGYSEGLTTSLPWLAVGLGLATEARLGSRLFVTLEATLWVPTQRQTFSVQNAGIARLGIQADRGRARGRPGRHAVLSPPQLSIYR
jgi:hypothetical protein